jgi:hypothetical protein
MSTMKSTRRPDQDASGGSETPEEVIDRLAELLPEGALDEAVKGLTLRSCPGPEGCCRSWLGG